MSAVNWNNVGEASISYFYLILRSFFNHHQFLRRQTFYIGFHQLKQITLYDFLKIKTSSFAGITVYRWTWCGLIIGGKPVKLTTWCRHIISNAIFWQGDSSQWFGLYIIYGIRNVEIFPVVSPSIALCKTSFDSYCYFLLFA